eukprot:UN09833
MYRFCNYFSVLSGRSRILEPGPRQKPCNGLPRKITTFNQQGADNDERQAKAEIIAWLCQRSPEERYLTLALLANSNSGFEFGLFDEHEVLTERHYGLPCLPQLLDSFEKATRKRLTKTTVER